MTIRDLKNTLRRWIPKVTVRRGAVFLNKPMAITVDVEWPRETTPVYGQGA